MKAVNGDAELRAKVMKVSDGADSASCLLDALLAIAQEAGFDVTKADYLEVYLQGPRGLLGVDWRALFDREYDWIWKKMK